MQVWPAEAHDLKAAAELIGEFRDWLGHSEPHDADLRASVERIATDGSGEFLLGALDDGDPTGVCQLRYRWSVWKTAEDCWLEDLFVRAPARRSGLGRALVENAVERAFTRGCGRVELDVDESNAPAIRLYEACGFSLESKAPGRTLLAGLVLRSRA